MSMPPRPSPPPQPQPQPQHHHHPPLQQQPYQPPQFNLELTIISGKHLKNVNWKNGDLKPYAIFWVDQDNKLTTKSDDSGHTKPVWNQRFTLPIPYPITDSTTLTLEIFHSKTSETPKPFVGSLQVPLSPLPDPTNHSLLRTFPLLRPSGRPHGKVRLKLSIKEDYQNTLVSPYYFSSAPPFPYPYYYPGYYNPSHGAPSAPAAYGSNRGGFDGGGVAVGAVAGTLGGLPIDEGLKREEVKVEESMGGGRDDFSDYRAEY